jgi:hypothetical protein
MQIKNQWKRPRDWKVVTGAGAVAALGITGLVLASPADGLPPGSISLEEKAQIAEATVPRPLPGNGIVDLSYLGDDLDSPFDDGTRNRVTGGDDSPDDSPAPGAGGGDDSPDDSPAPGAGGGDDSPDDSPVPGAGGGGGDDSPDDSPVPGAGGGDDSPDDSPAPGGGGGGGDDSGDDSQDS